MILTFLVGMVAGIAFSIVGMCCLEDWLAEREIRKQGEKTMPEK